MARITHVKKAQQRYKTVPVIDPETGKQKVTPVLRRDGSQKTTKRGKPVVRRVTVADKNQPLPNRRCDKCGKEIAVGDPYKWIAPKSGPYGGVKRYRCGTCPAWQVWEYSSSLSARIAQIKHTFPDISEFDSPDDVTEALTAFADEIRGLAEEKEESAQKIEDGFGHETYQSEELREVADNLNSWADEIEGVDVPDLEEDGEDTCEECSGSGEIEEDCEDCNGSGYEDDTNVDSDECSSCGGTGTAMDTCAECDGDGTTEPTDEQKEEKLDEWRSEVEDAVSIVFESPV